MNKFIPQIALPLPLELLWTLAEYWLLFLRTLFWPKSVTTCRLLTLRASDSGRWTCSRSSASLRVYHPWRPLRSSWGVGSSDAVILSKLLLGQILLALLASSVGWHLVWKLLLLSDLLFKLHYSILILEDTIVKISSAVWAASWIRIIVHDHIWILLAYHLNLLIWLTTIVWTISLVVLASQHKLLIVETTSVSLNDLALSCSLCSQLALSLGKFLLTLDCRPIDTISNWLSTTAKDREWVKPWIVSKDLFPILSSSYIVGTLERFA